MRHSAWNRRGQARVFTLPSWQIALILALALGIAIAVVATGIFLIALPIAALTVLAYRLFGGRRRQQRGPSPVIEGDCEVIDDARTSPWRGPGRR